MEARQWSQVSHYALKYFCLALLVFCLELTGSFLAVLVVHIYMNRLRIDNG